jgi:cyclopropane fatty-acyl-phospholipid synthase-like methyltransferase
MTMDPKQLVQKGYDQIALRYLEWGVPSPARMGYLQKVGERLPEGAEVLELGCGAGVPCTQLLAERAHVTGVDISAAQIDLARRHVPTATLMRADMMSLTFAARSFDAVVAFYSVIHLPRTEQSVLLDRVAEWLRPGGHLLLNLGTYDTPGSVEPHWLGAEMYWSGFDTEGNREMVRAAGFTLLEAEVLDDDEDGRLDRKSVV